MFLCLRKGVLLLIEGGIIFVGCILDDPLAFPDLCCKSMVVFVEASDILVVVVVLEGRDQSSDDDILLQPFQFIDLLRYGCLDQYSDRLLEGSGGKPRISEQRNLGESEQKLGSDCLLHPISRHLIILLLEFDDIDDISREEGSVSGIRNLYLGEHLSDDELDMLRVDRLPLRGVDLLDVVDDVRLGLERSGDIH